MGRMFGDSWWKKVGLQCNSWVHAGCTSTHAIFSALFRGTCVCCAPWSCSKLTVQQQVVLVVVLVAALL